MQKTKALILVDHLGVGGAQAHIYHLCRYLQKDDIHLTVCALHSGGKFQTTLAEIGIPVHVLSPKRHFINLPMIIWRLIKLTLKGDYHIIHTFLPVSFAVGTPISILRSIPTVHTILSERRAAQPWYPPLLRCYYNLVKLILVPLVQPIPNHIPFLFRRKIKIVPVAVHLGKAFAIQQKTDRSVPPNGLVRGDPLVVSIGRLHPDKGHEFAIRAWPQIARDNPAAKLLIVGEGNEDQRLKSLARSLGLTGQVVFEPYLELAPLFQRADIYLRTSINEGSNLSTMQAMAAGLAVIGFNNRSPNEIIRHMYNGLLVALEDSQELGRAIIKLSKDKALRLNLGQNARATIKRIYNLEDVIDYHRQIYTAAARRKPLEDIPDFRNKLEEGY